MATNMYGYADSRESTSQYNDVDRLSTPVYGKAAMEGYRKDVLNGFEQEVPRLNPLNPERPESSALVDLKDPIQVHLLTETALTDSKQYTILSQEEVDDLKKQCQYINQRIDSVRQNLAIQSKYRDAAISMARLYSTSSRSDSASGKRRSFRSSRSSQGEQQVREAELERQTCERKCEELATELFGLEKRIMEPQRRLLEHTAGILQLTHQTNGRKDGAPPMPGQVNGMPGSPESMYTMNREYDQDSFETYFEESGLQQLDRNKPVEVSPLEIPLKSPIREQQTQLREEVERARDENNTLLASVTEMERKFESLNMAVRETIIRFNPAVNGDYEEPPYSGQDEDAAPGELLRYHMDYLQSGLVAIQAEQEAAGHSQGQDPATEAVLSSLWETIQSGLAGMRQRREERRRARSDKGLGDDEDMSEDEGFDTDEPFTLTGFDTRIRWLHRQATNLKDQKSVLKRQIKQQRELNNKSDAEKDEELERKQQEVEESRLLISRAEKDATDAQKMLSDTLEDLEEARAAANKGAELRTRAADADAMEADLRQALRELKELKAAEAGSGQRLAGLDADIAALRSQLDEAQASHEEAENAAQQAESAVQDLQAQLDSKTAALEAKEAEAARAQDLRAQLDSQSATLKAKEDEMDQMGMQLAELKTEVTLARAELDGAYGTRAERAADVAAQQADEETARLRNQVETLKTELSETVKELEDITKETIGAEREKGELEGKLDDALHERELAEGEVKTLRERMEAEAGKMREQIGRLQEELDGERLKGGSGSGRGGGAGASMLSEQFRATMREERKKFQEDIREERGKNRRLEEELAKLRRAQGPGRSPLSPR